ncbi:hypothetical protein [Acinetobacter modestus]|uniref:hypothetical protein n=1 Tax=Acinetobacter modestus TaxID=1776740 RepID=UPI003017EF9C
MEIKLTLAKKQEFWSEQLPLFKASYWLPEHFELLKFDMDTGNFVVRDDIDPTFKDEADDLYHRINTGWSMWKRAVNHMQKKLEGCVVVQTQGLVLTCSELLETLEFGAPDLKIEQTEYSKEQMSTEIAIVHRDTGYGGSGLYAYCVECPEEGVIKLGNVEAPRGGK